jgi:O-antigen ligase
MNQAHNEPMQLAIEGGVPALILLLLFLSWWGRAAWRIAAPADPGRRRAIARAALSATVLLMLSSLVDYPLRTPLLGAVFAIACIEMLRAMQEPT